MALEIFDTSNPQSDRGLCEDNRIKLAHKIFLQHHSRIPDLLKYLITYYPVLPVVEVYITYLYKGISKSPSSWHRPYIHSSSKHSKVLCINSCAYGIPRAQAMDPLCTISKSLRSRAVQRSLSIWRPPEPELHFSLCRWQ